MPKYPKTGDDKKSADSDRTPGGERRPSPLHHHHHTTHTQTLGLDVCVSCLGRDWLAGDLSLGLCTLSPGDCPAAVAAVGGVGRVEQGVRSMRGYFLVWTTKSDILVCRAANFAKRLMDELAVYCTGHPCAVHVYAGIKLSWFRSLSRENVQCDRTNTGTPP